MKNDADEKDIPRIEGVLKVLKEMQERVKKLSIDKNS
jgi:hypothetical protein